MSTAAGLSIKPSTTMRYQPMVTILIAICAGIVVDSNLSFSLPLWWLCTFICLVIWFFLWKVEKSKMAAVAILLAMMSLSGSWHHLRWNQFSKTEIGRFAKLDSTPVCLQARVLKATYRVEAEEFNPMVVIPETDSTRFEIQIEAIRNGTKFQAASGKARITVAGHLLGLKRGDRVQVFGKFRRLGHEKNPLQFDPADFYRSKRQLTSINSGFPECVRLIEQSNSFSFFSWMDRLRWKGKRYFSQYLDRENAALASAVLLGARETLSTEQSDMFMQTGTFHLLAISGFHVGILAGVLFGFLKFSTLSRRQVVQIVSLSVIFYAILCGARPPVIRATVIVLVLCNGYYFRREQHGFSTLATAAVVVLALNPTDLFNTGTQLSFLAVATLIFMGSIRFGRLKHQPDPLKELERSQRGVAAKTVLVASSWFVKLTLASAVIWLVCLPLVMSRFHLLTPMSILLNTILWIPMVLVLISGFGLLLFSWLAPTISSMFAACCQTCLNFVTASIEFVHQISGSYRWLAGPDLWWLLGFYSFLMLLFASRYLQIKFTWACSAILIWVAIGFSVSIVQQHSRQDQLNCTFVSVGHGSAVIVELPDGRTILYDAGHLGHPKFAADSVACCLWSRGITHLDAIVISHADADHYNAIPQLLKQFSVAVVYVSPMMFEKESMAVQHLKQSIIEKQIPIREISSGKQLVDGAVDLSVLHPDNIGILGRKKDNANSIVLELQFAGRRILLTGDLEKEGLQQVMQMEPRKCDVLLAPHHGSLRSSPVEFANWANADTVVISGGSALLKTPQVAAIYKKFGSQVLETSKAGAVRFEISKDAISTKKWAVESR